MIQIYGKLFTQIKTPNNLFYWTFTFIRKDVHIIIFINILLLPIINNKHISCKYLNVYTKKYMIKLQFSVHIICPAFS